MADDSHNSASQDGDSDEDDSKSMLNGLTVRPMWSVLCILPQIHGLAGSAVDTHRSRLCTVTCNNVRDGRQHGVEVQLWSMRTGELQLSGTVPPLESDGANVQDGSDPHPGGLYYASSLRCLIGISGKSQLWAVDVVTLSHAGTLQTHDRQVIGFAFNSIPSEGVSAPPEPHAALSFIDGCFKVFHIVPRVLKADRRLRKTPLVEFVLVKQWREPIWCDRMLLDDDTGIFFFHAIYPPVSPFGEEMVALRPAPMTAGILFGAADLSLHAWRATTGAQLCHRAAAHTDKVPQPILRRRVAPGT